MSKFRGLETWGVTPYDVDVESRMIEMCDRAECETHRGFCNCKTCLFSRENLTKERKAAFLAWEEGEEE